MFFGTVLWTLFYFAVYVVFRKFQLCLSWSKRKITLFILSSFVILKHANQICQGPHLGIKVKSAETVKYRKRFWGKKQDGNWVRKKLIALRTGLRYWNCFHQVVESNWLCSIVYEITFSVDLGMCMRLLLGIISGKR